MGKPLVYLDKLANPGSLIGQFAHCLSLLGLAEEFRQAGSIFIKPNLTYFVYKEGVTTRKEFVYCLIAALREINSHTRIYVGEGEGGCNSFSMSETMHNMAFFDLEKEFPNVKVINLSEIPAKKVAIETRKGPYEVELPGIFFDEIDFSISCPLPKVHAMTIVTLSLKNLWGCLPDMMRIRHHHYLDHLLSPMARLLKFKYAFLDGKFGMNNNGPITGDVVKLDWFVGSNSLEAFDMIVAEIMGFPWRRINHLRVAADYGLMPLREDIRVAGDLQALQKRFKLQRDFWAYVALVPFKSKRLTHFVYLSRYAKVLHDIMYLFREREM